MTPEIEAIIKRLEKLEEQYLTLNTAVNKILGQTGSVELILKWVVLPLLFIVGGLVGVKIAMP